MDGKDYYVASCNQIAGGLGHPVIMYDGVEKKNTSVNAVWGLIPFWSKDQKEAMINVNKSVNARVETVEESRLYKLLFKPSQRCLVPCSYYFEHHWPDPEKKTSKKVPFAVRKNYDNIFSTPGLYSTWTDRKTGEIF